MKGLCHLLPKTPDVLVVPVPISRITVYFAFPSLPHEYFCWSVPIIILWYYAPPAYCVPVSDRILVGFCNFLGFFFFFNLTWKMSYKVSLQTTSLRPLWWWEVWIILDMQNCVSVHSLVCGQWHQSSYLQQSQGLVSQFKTKIPGCLWSSALCFRFFSRWARSFWLQLRSLAYALVLVRHTNVHKWHPNRVMHSKS